MNDFDALIYVLRHNNTSLWIDLVMAALLGVKSGDQLTVAQYESHAVQDLIEARRGFADSKKKEPKWTFEAWEEAA